MARDKVGKKEISHYAHARGLAESSITPDPRPGAYYVSVRDGVRYALLLGPFTTHAEALARVDEVASYAFTIDPKNYFYAYGTCRLPDDDSVPIRAGKFNDVFGVADP